ncbi:sphingomyelin phosphodiesterase isoform X1 [Cherax quadricarinatus]
MLLWNLICFIAFILVPCASRDLISAQYGFHDHGVEGMPAPPAHFLIHAFFQPYQELKDMTCIECKTAAAALDTMMAAGATVEELENIAITECINFNLFPSDVCSGMVKLCGAEVLYVLNNTDYKYDTICGWLLGGHCQNTELVPWTIEIPGGKPEPYHPEPDQNTPNVVRILHLTDTHVDLLYDEGSAMRCDHPLCCRHEFGEPGPGEAGAGHWGSLANCDIPLNTLEELIAQAALTNPDLVYMTGDLPAHDVWAQDHASNLAAINVTNSLLKQYFPDTPVINVLGNHASAPVNSFVVPAAYDDGWNMSWLYDGVASIWSHWLPEEVNADIKLGGFFSYSPLPGLRVVSINMNFCNTENWWLLLDNYDPVGELQWLMNTLDLAESSGELVHILGHIPPGSGDCDRTWSHVFNQIIARYESTIRAIFLGHTHGDSLQVYYDPDDNTRPVAAAFITPAGTTGSAHNPSFKVFTVDGGHQDATWSVIDVETYNMNLTEANMEGGTPDFSLRYSTQESYGITSLTPASIDQLVLNMATDESLFKKYELNTQNTWSDIPDDWSCDKDCYKGSLCRLVTGDSSNHEPCDRISAVIDGLQR